MDHVTSGGATTYTVAADGTRTAEEERDAGWNVTRKVRYSHDERGGISGIIDDVTGDTVATYRTDESGRVQEEARPAERTVRKYEWDAGDRLVGVKDTQLDDLGQPQTTTTRATYAYDYAGRRITAATAGGTSSWIWDAAGLVEERLPGSAAALYESVGGTVAAVGGVRALHDGLESIVGFAGGTTFRHDAWGNYVGGAPSASLAGVGYAGQRWDAEVGLSYAQQRWYEPRLGIFLSEDPLGVTADRLAQPTGLHAFGYASANPVRYVDPDGRESRQLCELKAKAHERYWDDRKAKAEYHSAEWHEAARSSHAALAEFTQCEVDEWRFYHLDFPLAMNGAVAAVAAPVAAGWQLAGKVLLGVGTFFSAYQATEVVTGEKTELFAPGGPRVTQYESCNDLMTCQRMWDGVSAGSGLFLSFTGGAAMTRAQGGRLFTNDRAEGAATWLEGQLSREVEITLPPLRDEVTGAELVYSNPLPRVRLKGPSGRVSTEKYLENNWDRATFPSVRKSVDYHVGKHGKGLSDVEYTQRAVKAFGDENAVRTKSTDLLGRPALRVQSDLGSGLFTPHGRIIWFHPKL